MVEEKNSYQLKIVGVAELPEKLETDKSLALHFEAEIYSCEKLDNQDGTFTIRYKAKINGAVDFVQGEKKIKSKDKTKKSQRLRWKLEAKGIELGLDPKVYYDEQMDKIINQV